MASVGTETVEVVPDARGFKEKLDAQLRDLKANVQLALDSGPASAKIEAVKTQIRSIGTGKAKITADTAEIDAKIAGVKAQIRSIQSDRATVNVDTAAAAAKIAALRAQEKALKDDIGRFQTEQGNNSVPVDAGRQLAEVRSQIAAIQNQSVSVRVDTAEAAAKLATLRAELDAATRERTVKVNADDNGSSDSLKAKLKGIADGGDFAAAAVIGRMALIGVAIAAIIPLAAAASIAVAGIGLGIAAGLGALLVGGLALGGVGAAVKAGSAPGQGAQSAQQQAQAQQGITDAINAQHQAQIALTVAQRDATQAQKDLTQARIDAANTLESLNNAVTDNTLSQRQAAIDVANTALALKTAQASPDAQNPANATALAQVQLAFDQAKQKQLELSEAGTQATQAAAQANALGVSGAQNVVDAQNKVIDTTNAVAQAQFTVQDSAQKVALAQQSAANQTSAYGTALQKLDPTQKAFAAFLLSLKPIFDTVKTAAADSFLPLLQKAIESLLPVMPQIAIIVGNIGTAFGDLAIKAAGFFTSPDGQKFLDFISNSVGPAIDTMGKIFGGLFEIAAGFFEQAYPLIKEFGDAIAGALGGAAGGVQGGALNGFFAYIKENAPQIKDTLEKVLGAIGSILKSLAPLGGPVLKVIGELAVDLAAMVKVVAPLVKDLIPFAPLILAIVLAFKAWVVVQGILDALLDANPIGLIVLAVAALTLGIIFLVQHWKEVVAFLQGPWGTALAAALVPIVPFIAIPALIIGHWEPIKNFFTGLWNDVTGAITTGVTAVVNFFSTAKSDIGKAWNDIWDGLAAVAVAAFDGIVDAIKGTINGVITLIDDAIKTINSDLIDKANAVPFVNIPHIPQIQHLAAGGLVGGVGSGTSDNQLIAASPGEFMLTAAAYSKYPDLAQAMNNGHQVKGGSDINVYPSAGMDEVAIAYAVGRRLQFAGA